MFTSAAPGAVDGRATFDQLCAGCHTVGGGDGTGPDLKGLADRREREWARRMIVDPAGLIGSGDPDAKALVDTFGMPMPTLGVTDEQADALLEYLGYTAAAPGTGTGTTTMPAPAPAPSAPAGDPARGEDLFTGAAGFSAGGPSCLSCHNVAGAGTLGGGRLGPDLTGAFAKYGGAQGLTASLATVPFPTMAPIFTRAPLTAAEQADIVAYLETAPDREAASSTTAWFIGAALLVAVVIAILAALIWRRRLPTVRRSLVNRTLKEH